MVDKVNDWVSQLGDVGRQRVAFPAEQRYA